MMRHVIAGRLGPDDDCEIPVSVDEQFTPIQFVAGHQSLGYGIGAALSDLAEMDLYPSEVGIDLLLLAAHVHAADTRISREEESQDTWTREIRLVVPVSDPELWNATTPTLRKMLNFLTGDRWDFGFRSRPARFTSLGLEAEQQPLEIPFNVVSLFSGGLDSLIGAIDLLETGSTPLFVSHWGEGAVSHAQGQLIQALKNNYLRVSFDHLKVRMIFPNGLVDDVKSEDSTRGRSFLFFALGVFAGSGIGNRFTLRVPENGLIALNVPLDPLRLGSNSTRTTHPYYIARWNELLIQLGIDAAIENPYWDKTKGEMASQCENRPLLSSLMPHSLSCSSIGKARWLGRAAAEHCGYCLPCLIRRAAIEAAFGQGRDTTPYTVGDLREHAMNTLAAEGVQIRSFQYAIQRLRARPELAAILVHKPGSLTDDVTRLDQFAGVYRRGLMEVAQLIDGVVTRPR